MHSHAEASRAGQLWSHAEADVEIDRQVTLGFTDIATYPGPEGAVLAWVVNDSLSHVVARHPDRFAALGAITLQNPQAATQEIERIVGPLALHGVMINSHTDGHYLDEPQFDPVLEAAEAHHAPIYLHPRFPSMLAPYDAHGLQGAIWGYQAEAGLHAMRMILSGVFDRHPGLTVVLGHLGEGIPYWLKRIDNRYAFASRVTGAADAAKRLDLTPSEYFCRNFVITTSGMSDPDVLGLAIKAVGDDNVMFAIDTPYEDSADAVASLHQASLSETQRSNIGHATAERVFGLAPA